jgi:hypothetical protein
MPVTGGFILGYNCQLAVAADHLILAVDIVQDLAADLSPAAAHRFHSVRRGMSPEAIAALLGHETLAITTI